MVFDTSSLCQGMYQTKNREMCLLKCYNWLELLRVMIYNVKLATFNDSHRKMPPTWRTFSKSFKSTISLSTIEFDGIDIYR